MGHAAWNGQDDRLKERLFGLTNGEGNHGEDAKEYWWALDATPTHIWARHLYRYPQAAFPYDELRRPNADAGLEGAEVRLADTGVLDGGRGHDGRRGQACLARHLDPDSRLQPPEGRSSGPPHDNRLTTTR